MSPRRGGRKAPVAERFNRQLAARRRLARNEGAHAEGKLPPENIGPNATNRIKRAAEREKLERDTSAKLEAAERRMEGLSGWPRRAKRENH